MIKELKKNNQILCTSRNYREVTQLAKLRKMKLDFVGMHGGADRIDKLNASTQRTIELTKKIQKFKPDLTISFCSPEASRISYGLKIRHIAFCDSPHAEAVMRLCLPLVQKLLIPWIIPKKEFTKYGIDAKDIIPYRAIDAAIIIKNSTNLQNDGTSKNILIRVGEDQAAYLQGHDKIFPIIRAIITKFPNHQVLVLPRYTSQIGKLKQTFGKKIHVLDKVAVGNSLLQNTGIFLGSGGTMTAESALLGIPTISYNVVPNLVQDYLVRKRLVILEQSPKKIVRLIEKMLFAENKQLKKNAKETLASMEDPLKKLIKIIKTPS